MARTRSFHRTRAIALCEDCGQRAAGVTTVETRPWAHPAEHIYHRCDSCAEAIIERPLDAVLLEFVSSA
jgi:hypothetical protein